MTFECTKDFHVTLHSPWSYILEDPGIQSHLSCYSTGTITAPCFYISHTSRSSKETRTALSPLVKVTVESVMVGRSCSPCWGQRLCFLPEPRAHILYDWCFVLGSTWERESIKLPAVVTRYMSILEWKSWKKLFPKSLRKSLSVPLKPPATERYYHGQS